MNNYLLVVNGSTVWFYDVVSGILLCLFLIFLLYFISIILNLIYSLFRKEKVVWDKDHIFKKRRGVLIALMIYTLLGVFSGIYLLFILPEQSDPSYILASSIAVILLFVLQYKTLRKVPHNS